MGKDAMFLEWVFQSMEDGICVVDTKHTILQANQAMKQLYQHHLPLEGKKCFQVFQEREEPCPSCFSLVSLQSGTLEPREILGPLGSDKEHLEILSYPFHGTGREDRTGTVKIVRDITGRKKKEDAVLEQVSLILQSMATAVITTDEKGSIIHMNPLAQEYTGQSFSKGKNRPLLEIFHLEEDQTGEGVFDPIQEVLDRGETVYLPNHTVLISSAGRKRHIRACAAPIFHHKGLMKGVILTFSDESKEYIRDQELQANQKEKTLILNSISETCVFYDRKMRIRWMNKRAEDLVGESWQDLKGTYCYHTWFDRDSICEGCPMEKVIKKGQPNEGEVVTPTGKILLVKGYPVFDEEHSVVGFIELGLDITDKKKMEMALKESKEKLEQIHELTLQMSRSRKEDEIYQLIVKAATSILHLTRYNLYVRTDDSFVVRFSSGGDSAQILPLIQNEEIESPLREEVFIPGHEEDKTLLSHTGVYASSIRIPIGDMGFFQIFSPQEGRFDREDIRLLDMTIAHGTEVLRSIHSGTKLEHLSLYDHLTKLFNRSYLEAKIKHFDKDNFLPISIIMADINGLKLVNDTYGYRKGDLLLISAANILKESCRGDDIITRWGGDEFIIFLTHTSRKEAQIICNRILKECKNVMVEGIPLQIALGSATKKEEEESIFGVLKRAEDLMYKQKLTENRSARGKIISTLLKTLGEKSDETEEHAWRMQKMAMDIGEKIGLPPEELDRLSLLLTLHDIGKIAISEEILTKPGRLTEEEWEIIKEHPVAGSRIASSSEDFAHVAEEILYHHERWDGTGYPKGLKETEIPILARVTSIVDSFDVMTNKRSYKEAMSREEAITEMQKCAGSQFDPHLVEVFVEMISYSNER